jgi:hypothetical protein
MATTSADGTAAERLDFAVTRTKSSESRFNISVKTAEELLDELGAGAVYDELRAVVPVLRSSTGLVSLTRRLGEAVLADLAAQPE